MQQFLVSRWFLIVLALVLLVSMPLAEQLEAPASRIPRGPIVAGVLFLMALPLETRAMGRALRRPGATLLAVCVNFAVVPFLAWIARPLLPGELGTGLVIVACIPTTLASATVWTRRAGGNDAVAILVTMITNLGCFLVTPALLSLLTNTEIHSDKLGFSAMTERLLVLVVCPIVAGQLLRLYRPVGVWATHHKAALGVLAQCGILTIVALGTIDAGVKLASRAPGEGIQPVVWLTMISVVIGVHVGALAIGHILAHWAGMSRADRIAVGFSGSQKTLMVGLEIGLGFFGGLTVLPMVAYHVCQLLVDTLIADRLRGQGHKAPLAAPVEPD